MDYLNIDKTIKELRERKEALMQRLKKIESTCENQTTQSEQSLQADNNSLPLELIEVCQEEITKIDGELEKLMRSKAIPD